MDKMCIRDRLREWDEKREQDWFLQSYPIHDAFHRFMKELNHIYIEHPAFYEKDYENAGFQWLDCHQEEKCIYVFERRSGSERIMAMFNFSDKLQKDFVVDVYKRQM